MMKEKIKNDPIAMGLLLMCIYIVSYITRLSYSSVIVEMTSATGLSKTQLSLAVTASFFAYAVGQLISGALGDRIHPKKLITCGLAVATATNLIIPLCTFPAALAVIWGINGASQAFLWPPMIRLMTFHLTEEGYRRASTVVAYGSSLGTVAIYLSAHIVLTATNDYRAVFIFSAVAGIIAIPAWLMLCPSDKTAAKRHIGTGKKTGAFSLIFTPTMLLILFSIVFHGFIRDGISTWMPTFVSENFNIGSNISILSSIILPVFAMISIKCAALVCSKWLKSPLACAAFFFAFSAVSCAVLITAGKLSPVLSVVCLGIVCGSIHGVNYALISILPGLFAESGYVSSISGVLNACTYVGSTVSSFGTAALSESAGWGAAELLWLVCAVLGAVICFAVRHNVNPPKALPKAD